MTSERTRTVPAEKAQEPTAPCGGDASEGEIFFGAEFFSEFEAFSEVEFFPESEAFSGTAAVPGKRQHPSEKAGAKPGKSDVIP